MTYNSDTTTMYKLGYNRGRSGIKNRGVADATGTNPHYRQGIRDGYAQYQRDKLEQLVLGEQHE